MGEGKGMGIWAYDPAEKVYTYYALESSGHAFLSKGKVEGDTWTWKNDMKMGDKTLQSLFTIKQISADVYTFKWETSPDGLAWTAFASGPSPALVDFRALLGRAELREQSYEGDDIYSMPIGSRAARSRKSMDAHQLKNIIEAAQLAAEEAAKKADKAAKAAQHAGFPNARVRD